MLTRGVKHPFGQFPSSDRERFIYTIPCRYPRCGALCPGTCIPVLMFRVKCSCFRAKAAHMSRHLPPNDFNEHFFGEWGSVAFSLTGTCLVLCVSWFGRIEAEQHELTYRASLQISPLIPAVHKPQDMGQTLITVTVFPPRCLRSRVTRTKPSLFFGTV
jgi:hypothetical protein